MSDINVREFILITASLMLTGIGYLYADSEPDIDSQAGIILRPATTERSATIEMEYLEQWSQSAGH